MVRVLVSVRDADEALAAAEAGADLIDLKEPSDGALGAVSPAQVAKVVAMLRLRHPSLRISATVGDLLPQETDEILRRVERIASCGVDYVKVGLWPGGPPGATTALLDALAACGAAIVPVLVADEGVEPGLLAQALEPGVFPALMLDTADKKGGSLLQRVPLATLAAFVSSVQATGAMAGLAGSLRLEDAALLRALGPDFAGFRGALTRGGRAGALDAQRVRQLRRRLAAGAAAPLPAAA